MLYRCPVGLVVASENGGGIQCETVVAMFGISYWIEMNAGGNKDLVEERKKDYNIVRF
jgi:hypothetical protein